MKSRSQNLIFRFGPSDLLQMTIGLCFLLGCIHTNNVPRIYGSSGYTGSIVQLSVSIESDVFGYWDRGEQDRGSHKNNERSLIIIVYRVMYVYVCTCMYG